MIETDHGRVPVGLASRALAAPADRAARPPPSYRTFIYNAPTSTITINGDGDDDGHGERAHAHAHGQERAITLLEEQTVLQAGTTGLRTW